MIDYKLIKTSLSDSSFYKQKCALAAESDEFFEVFKNDKHYNEILEHVSEQSGQEYLDYIKSNLPDWKEKLSKFSKNDTFGSPRKFYYADVGYMSPTTLRYAKVLTDLVNLFGDLSGKKIAEIGTGYGGQSLIINECFDISEYYHFDLNEAMMLSKKYLGKFGLKNQKFISMTQIPELNIDFDLVISNYAFSEIQKELQNVYVENVIKRSKNGYLTLNFIPDFSVQSYSLESIKQIIKEKNPKVIDEFPLTGQNNKILYF